MASKPELTTQEQSVCTTWLNSHRRRCSRRHRILLIPTSQGVKVLVRCACGKQEDLTDYKTWRRRRKVAPVSATA